jgi:hypothetical protein
MTPELEKSETYSPFIADCALYLLYLHNAARNVAL